MPKHPGTVFHTFFADAFPGFSGGLRTQEHSQKWQQLDDAQKKEYTQQYHEKLVNYRQKLQEWREKMKDGGHEKMAAILEFGKGWRSSTYAPEARHDQAFRQLASENEKPKYPTPAFNRFRQYISSVSPEVVKVQECRRLWSNLSTDEQKKYKDAFHAEYVVYRQKMQDWKAQLIADGRKGVVNKLESVYNRVPPPSVFDKPTYPVRPIDRFRAETSTENDEDNLSENHWLSMWRKLSPAEKKKYTEPFKADMVEYREELAEWKRNMIVNGHEELMNFQLRSRYSRENAKIA
uniref:HMG box domain-containing protein n=1 Tax=Plectus sambesii TaxID=2011161 RepID=A0A914WYY5_9BILA